MSAASAKSKAIRTRAKNGQKAEGGRMSRELVAVPAPQAPLDFALRIMRDDSKPDSLRATMARAAMPYLHKRGEAKEEKEEKAPQEEWSDLELARRIAHILGLAEQEGFEQLESAQEAACAADKRARVAEVRAQEMEQRMLAAEAMIAGREPEKKVPLRSDAREVAPGRVTTIATDLHPPVIERYPSHNPAPVMPNEDHDQCAPDAFDPHPGYRWI